MVGTRDRNEAGMGKEGELVKGARRRWVEGTRRQKEIGVGAEMEMEQTAKGVMGVAIPPARSPFTPAHSLSRVGAQ